MSILGRMFSLHRIKPNWHRKGNGNKPDGQGLKDDSIFYFFLFFGFPIFTFLRDSRFFYIFGIFRDSDLIPKDNNERDRDFHGMGLTSTDYIY